jgi:hypothetical protein
LKEKFPRISDSKIKEGIFVGPHIKASIQDGKFKNLLSQTEKSAWKSFKGVVKIFLGNHKAPPTTMTGHNGDFIVFPNTRLNDVLVAILLKTKTIC